MSTPHCGAKSSSMTEKISSDVAAPLSRVS
jgi:hypothetical protein